VLSAEEILDRSQRTTINISADADPLIAAQGAGIKIVVVGFWLVAGGGANSIQFKSGTVAGGTIPAGAGAVGLGANGGIVIMPFLPLFECVVNEPLAVDLSAATAVGGAVYWVEDRA
jgi:hypothetical protein